MSKKTPLYQFHLENQGKMVEFGGYLLPVNYPLGIITEHKKVRTEAGLFDVSHMAEIFVYGPEVRTFLNNLLTNDFTSMKNSQIKYTLMLNEDGYIIDDLLVYCFDDHAMLVCNAANHDKDLSWIKKQASDDIEVIDKSEETALLALQGPFSQDIISQFVNESDIPQKYYTFKQEVDFLTMKVLISRTGYTGEDGFEIYCQNSDVQAIAQALLSTKQVTLCGLGARDTLRLEAGLPLYGHEMSETITPFETNLGFFTKMNKENFIGKEALLNKEVNRTRVGIKLIDRGIAREGSVLYIDHQEVGIMTSGTQLPYVGYAGGMALINKEYSAINTELIVDVRGRRLKAEVIQLPFYSRKKEEK